MKKILVIIFMLFSFQAYGGEITVTRKTALDTATKLVEKEEYQDAYDLLKTFAFNVDTYESERLEIERLFLIAECLTGLKRYNEAIALYQQMLDYNPKLTRIRIELAHLYFLKEEWYRAERQYKIASADEMPADTLQFLNYQRYLARKNRKWNAWFSLGVAPDNNINNAIGGNQCILTIFGVLCRKLDEPKKAVGYNVNFGGNYEFGITDGVKLKTELSNDINKYNISEYDETTTTFSIGPRFSFYNADIWLAGYYTKDWVDNAEYSSTKGLKLNTAFDFGKSYVWLNNNYGITGYEDYNVSVKTYTLNSGYSYNFTSSLYASIRYGYSNTHTEYAPSNRNTYGVSVGYLFASRFNVDLSYTKSFINYKKERTYIKDLDIIELKEKDIINNYSISLSDRNIDIFGFTPIITYTRQEKNSNVPEKNLNKNLYDITLTRRF